jgi:hypothetical protein
MGFRRRGGSPLPFLRALPGRFLAALACSLFGPASFWRRDAVRSVRIRVGQMACCHGCASAVRGWRLPAALVAHAVCGNSQPRPPGHAARPQGRWHGLIAPGGDKLVWTTGQTVATRDVARPPPCRPPSRCSSSPRTAHVARGVGPRPSVAQHNRRAFIVPSRPGRCTGYFSRPASNSFEAP